MDATPFQIAALQSGETVQIRPHGQSMRPKVRDGARVTVAPCQAVDLKVGDIVLVRGRGRGFVRALREDVSVVRPLLLDCVTHDPRWDRQIELPSDYYAALIMHTAMPLDPFDAYLHALSGTAAGHPHDALVLDTMCALATRGHTPAIAI